METYSEKTPPLDRDKVKSMYESGMTQKEIVAHFECAKSTVCMILKDTPKRPGETVTERPKIICPTCGKKFKPATNKREFCSNDCRAATTRVRPPKDDLIKKLAVSSQSQVARDLGVSRQAVSRWVKEFDIPLPRRGKSS